MPRNLTSLPSSPCSVGIWQPVTSDLTSVTVTRVVSAGYDGLSEAHAALALKSLKAAAEEPLDMEITGRDEDGFTVRAPAIDAELRAAGAAL